MVTYPYGIVHFSHFFIFGRLLNKIPDLKSTYEMVNVLQEKKASRHSTALSFYSAITVPCLAETTIIINNCKHFPKGLFILNMLIIL